MCSFNSINFNLAVKLVANKLTNRSTTVIVVADIDTTDTKIIQSTVLFIIISLKRNLSDLLLTASNSLDVTMSLGKI